jgi:ElaB/YqjD/DUF883 family membrane-anchored ribosome-binding protein
MSDTFDDGEVDITPVNPAEAEALVREVLDLVQNARVMPLSTSALVDQGLVVNLLEEILIKMPEEVRQARWLLREQDEFIASKAREADALMEEVRVQAERMVQRTEIVRQANQVAQKIIDEANERSRMMIHEVEDFVDRKLASFEIVLDRTLKTVQGGREKLQAVPLPQMNMVEPATANRGDEAEPASRLHEESEGFFDQDLA